MKHLFAYIKENGLKDPEDGRFFIPDKKMAKIFGNEKLRSFGMSKFIGEHLSKIDDEWNILNSCKYEDQCIWPTDNIFLNLLWINENQYI